MNPLANVKFPGLTDVVLSVTPGFYGELWEYRSWQL